jgi:hypothetical protein
MMAASVALSLWVTNSSIRGMRSRTSRAAVALRKKLTAARQFFSAELRRPQPALRDDWYPWVLAFGLGDQADAWSTVPAATSTDGSPFQSERSSSDSSAPARPEWTGFGGGRSGGAGGGAAWSAAAAGMAASVPSPASSGSDSSGSSSGGGDSGGGSSGGGGGGGW